MSADLRNIAVSQIRENPVALRGVDKEAEAYVHLRDAIRAKGVLNPISVREKQDADGTIYFEICDGLHRFSVAQDLGLSTLPAQVVNLDDAETLEAQVVANLCRVETKPIEYTKQLQRMFAMNPTLTVAEVADRVNQSPSFVTQRLGLLKLDETIQRYVDDGKINVTNAYNLSKLPREEQLNLLDAAMTQAPGEFAPTVQKRVKELKDAARQGKPASEATFAPIAHLRKLAEIKAEQANGKAGPAVVAAIGATTAAEGFAAGLAWVLSLDPSSVAAQQAAHDARQQKLADEKKRREVERAEKKAVEAAAAAAAAREAAAV